MATRWVMTSTASAVPYVGVGPTRDLVEVVADLCQLAVAVPFQISVRCGPGVHSANRPAH